MMKVLAALALALSCSYSAAAQTATDAGTAKDRSGVVGPVSALRLEAAAVSVVSGRPVEGPRVLKQTISFDEKGNATTTSVFNPDGSVRSKLGRAYTYDAEGRVAEWCSLDADGAPTGRAVPAYGEQGREVETTFFHPDGSVHYTQTYTYDERGNITRKASRSPDGRSHGWTVHTYDDSDRLTETAFYTRDGTLSQRNVYAYDARGRETEWNAYRGDGTHALGFTRRYDESGNVVESLHSANGSLVSRRTYTYEFDARGNWVKRRAEVEEARGGVSKVVPEVTYRTITYY
jgi:YD repeat-containing protein